LRFSVYSGILFFVIEKILKEVTASLSPRAREVLVRRFGLKNSRPETLEGIGASYGITRERVRQIEAAALAAAKKNAAASEMYGSFEKRAHGYLEQAGGARVESKFLEELQFLVDDRHPAAAFRLRFLLSLSPRLWREEETERLHAFWASEADFATRITKFLGGIVKELRKTHSPLPISDVEEFLSKIAANAGMAHFPTGALVEFVHISKEIALNPYGEWGLTEWETIVPGGVRNRAYYVLREHRKPLHFRELAKLLNEHARLAVAFHPAWQKIVEAQTVHNELIKDKRFVLVGRGTYALAEWGYKPGTVREILVDILRTASKPLSKEEILRRVREQRFVKDATVLINLHNSKTFERLKDGRYRLRGSTRSQVREA
jgi:hypothetical protein